MSALSSPLLPLAWRNLWRNPGRTGITLVVVAVGLWSVLVFNAFMQGWAQSSKDSVLRLMIGSGQIHAPGYLDDPSIDALMSPPGPALRATLDGPEVAHWAERLPLPAVVLSEYKTLPTTLVGVDPAAEAQLSSIPGKVVQGRYLRDTDEAAVVLGLHMAERLKTGLGRRVILMSQTPDEDMAEQSFDVIGLFDADTGTEDLYVFTGRAAAQRFVGLKDQIGQIAFALAPEGEEPLAIARIAQAAPDLDVRGWRQLALFLATTESMMGVVVYVWLAVVFTLIAIGIINTQLMAVFERTREFGLLRAVGMRPRAVLWMVTLENIVLVGLGALLGLGLALATFGALRGGIDFSRFARAMEMVQAAEVIHLRVVASEVVLFTALIWGLGVGVALWPARRAARAAPVEAMRHGR